MKRSNKLPYSLGDFENNHWFLYNFVLDIWNSLLVKKFILSNNYIARPLLLTYLNSSRDSVFATLKVFCKGIKTPII